MNREDIIRMAREAGCTVNEANAWSGFLERFAALVAAAEREAGQKWFDAVTAQHKAEILAEREACAKVAENLPPFGPMRQLQRATLKDCAVAIRARGQA